MGRRRAPIASCHQELRVLSQWLRDRIDERGLIDGRLADLLSHSPSGISRALSGRRVPSWRLTEQITVACGGSVQEARRLWEAANSAQSVVTWREVVGGPPIGIKTHHEFCKALRALTVRRALSHRELVRRDASQTLRRSTVGAVLSGRQSASWEVTVALLRAIDVSDAACTEWSVAWNLVERPHRVAMDHERRRTYRNKLTWGMPW